MRRLALLLTLATAACADLPTHQRSGPAIIRLDLRRANQLAASTAVDVSIAYERTGAANKDFFATRVNLASATQQVSLTVDLAECLADAAHVGGAGVCTLHVTASLLDADSTVLDRQVIGPLTAQPGRLATQNDVALYATSQRLAVGSSHACLLRTRQAYCWGSNNAGQLGDGTLTARYTTVPVTGGFQFIALASGFETTCGLTADSTVVCWGINVAGEVGDGTLTRNKSTPAPVVGGLKFTSVAAGAGFTCALTPAGAPYCWGFNFYGQLGDGTTTDRTAPTAVSGSPAFASLALGSVQSCGLTSAGVAYCWGTNTNGTIGDGTSALRLTPTPVSGGLTFKSITSGYQHSCGLTNAGVAYCWGLNSSGELGDGTTTSRLVPTAVSGGRTFTKLAAAKNGNSEGSTCGIVTDGTVYCWGSNRVGQLGDGTLVDKSVPTAVAGGRRFTTLDSDNGGACGLAPDGSPWCWGRSGITTNSTYIRTTPIAVTGLQNATSVSAGSGYACAIVSGGGASCWGDNLSGTLGDGSATPRSTPQSVVGGVTFASIVAGTVHTCAVSIAGAAYCWGANSTGQLGNGTTGNATIAPAPVGGGLTFASIGVGGSGSGFTCGLTTLGAAFCWGTNLSGTVGDGTTTLRLSPVAVAGGRTYQELKVGGNFACGRVPTGAVFCWGFNAQGQLGNGSPSILLYETSPVAVVGVPFSTIAAGTSHACGTAITGVSYCWGNNAFGQLGNGTSGSNQNLSPVQVSGGSSFSSYAAGSAHTCALTVAGKAYCWGSNSSGQLGDGTDVSSSVPIAVAGNHVFTGLSAGNALTCGWKQTGAVLCWGDDYRGQIGDGTFGYSLVPVLIPIGS